MVLNTVDPKNPVLVITYNDKTAELPVNKDVMTIDGGEEIELDGISRLCSKGGQRQWNGLHPTGCSGCHKEREEIKKIKIKIKIIIIIID
ncbi:MAG: hypothetical protein SCH66_11660 [Methanolobus sp.]|nr:hypothetical protein [Methanolobus sp.]